LAGDVVIAKADSDSQMEWSSGDLALRGEIFIEVSYLVIILFKVNPVFRLRTDRFLSFQRRKHEFPATLKRLAIQQQRTELEAVRRRIALAHSLGLEGFHHCVSQ
jgi:hypothetical protein